MKNKIEIFAKLVETETIARLQYQKLACDSNIQLVKTTVISGKKYTKVNIGTGGRYMVENSTGNIFGIKGYGVIHRGHFYGTVDEINQWYWGNYYPTKILVKGQIPLPSGCPPLTFAPAVPEVPF